MQIVGILIECKIETAQLLMNASRAVCGPGQRGIFHIKKLRGIQLLEVRNRGISFAPGLFPVFYHVNYQGLSIVNEKS